MIKYIAKFKTWQNVLVMLGNLVLMCFLEASAGYVTHLYHAYRNNGLNYFWASLGSDILGTLFLCSIVWFFAYIVIVLTILENKNKWLS